MNPIILPPVKLRLKNDLVSYPARAEGLGKYDNWDRNTRNHKTVDYFY